MRSPTSWSDLLTPGWAADYFARRPMPPFDVDNVAYSRANAIWLAELSRLVYRRDQEEDAHPPSPTRREILEKSGFTQKAFFLSRETNTQGMLVLHDEPQFAVLAFRGTEQTVKDFVTDLNIGVETLVSEEIAVHEGFRDALDSVWPAVDAELEEVKCPLFFTGHSLGGALATLAATRHKPSALYTFGAPRVGNQKFAESLHGIPAFRVVDDWDLVTLLPPEALGFRHAGELTKVIEKRVRFSLNPVAWIKLVFSPSKRLADHAPVNYVDRI